MRKSRILIADDHALIAELCKRLLEPEFEVVGVVTDGRAVIRKAAELKPDVALLDIAMPGLNGLDAAQWVKSTLPSIKILFLTVNSDPEVAAEAFRRGGSGYLIKTCAAKEIVLAVREIVRGKTYLSPQLPKDTVNYLRRSGKALVSEDCRLTDRQREVLQLIVEGKAMKEIGAILQMQTRTVAFHKYRIMEVLGATSDSDLVRYAIRTNIVSM